MPAGYYRFSIVGTGNGYTNSLRVYANGADKYASETSSTLTVVVELTDEQDLEVGVQHYPVYQWSYGKWDNAKLEYIGTNVATYQIDDPVLTFENNSYVDDVQSFTYDFINQVTTDNSVSFALLNPDAKVLIKKNGTTVKEGSVTLDGTKLTADFSGFTPERGTTYTLTLPAGVVGFAGHLSNVERTITFHTSAIVAGYYYLRNNDSSWNTYYLSRGGGGSQAYMDNFGLAVHIDTNKDGGTTIQFFDSRQWLYGDGWTWTDQGDINYALKFTVEPQGNNVYKFKTLGRTDNGYLAIWDGKAVCDGRPGDNLLGNTNQWTLESIADHHANNDTRNKDAQAAALGLAGVSTWAQLESQMTANYSGEVVYTDITETVDHWQWGAHTAYEHQLTGLQNGIYRITVNALQRATQWDWMWEIDNTYGVNDVRYLYGNDQKTLIMSNTEDGATYSNTDGMYWHNDKYYPNNTPSAERAFAAGKYKNTLYVKVTNGTLNIGIVDPCGIPANNQWLAIQNLKVERMVSGLVGLEADGITDGGYISSPITSVTIKPLNTELTSVTIANNTKVTIYKDGTQLSQVTPTKSGANLIVALPTLVNGSTYKLTLDEKKLTYNNNSKNAAFEVTFKTPHIYDGTYYLYNVRTDDFIERSGNEVYTTFLGQSITWTNGTNGATIKFNDGETNSYLGGRWYSCSNESEGNALRWEATLYNGAYKLNSTNPVDGGWNYLYVNEGGNGDHVASNGRCKEDDNDNNNFNTWSNGTGLWKFMTQADYDAYVRTLNDTDAAAPASSNDQSVKVVLNRKITKDTWNTICFPFAMSSEQITAAFGNNTIVKALDGANINGQNATVSFSEVTSIEANTPYILKTTQDTKEQFLLRGFKIEPSTSLTTTKNPVQFIGNYIYPFAIPQGDYYIKDNKFYSSPGSTKLKGYRAYFHVNESSVKSLNANFDGEATAIEGIEQMIDWDNAEVYDLSGRRVRRPSKGFYIVNGKKMFVK